MYRTLKMLLGALAPLLATPAHAIVINGIDGVARAEQLARYSDYDSVVAIQDSQSLTFCTGALISAYAVATARHCTDDMTAANTNVFFGDDLAGNGSNPNPGVEALYRASSFVTMTPDPGRPGSYFNATDLAIIYLDQIVTGFQPFKVFAHDEGAQIVREAVTFAGFGRSGTGATGDSAPVDFVKRAADNTFDSMDRYAVPGGESRMFYADFDDGTPANSTLPGTETRLQYEGLVGAGDSGGPLMFWRDELVVGGVLTGIYDSNFDGTFGTYGDVGAWTSFYSAEARSMLADAGATFYATPATVPLPATALLLLAALGGLLLCRRAP